MMIRFLLTTAAAVSIAGAFAFTAIQPDRSHNVNPLLKERTPKAAFVKNDAPRQQPRNLFREADANGLSFNWGYCEGLMMAIPMSEGEMQGAIVIDEAQAAEFAGGTISEILVGNPIDISTQDVDYDQMIYIYDNPIREATVWIKEAIDKEPVVSVRGELGARGFVWSTIQLPEAYTIKGDSEVIIGYTIDVPENDGVIYPFITDYSYDVNKNSCMVYTNFQGFDDSGWLVFDGPRKWQDLGADFGNIGIRAHLNGVDFPTDKVLNYASQGPMYVDPSEPFEFMGIVQNLGGNLVTTVDYTMEIEGMEPQTCTVEVEPVLEYKEISNVLFAQFDCTTIGNNIPWKAYISAVNGTPVELDDEPIEGMFLCIDEGYPKNNVFEEATGTWCGWCVIGYAGMEYMAQNYSDQGFIGIAVHGGDQMNAMGEGYAYSNFDSEELGFPSAFINRDMASDVYPSPEDLADVFGWIEDIPAYAKVSATLTEGGKDKTLKLSTSTEFGGTEENGNYMIAYTVLEDEVGPYIQSNYCSGEDYDYYGFENLPERVPLKFNDVARNCSKPLGVEGSLPTNIVKGEEYTYETEIELTDVTNPDKVRVVAMVINGNNGAIENAAVVKSPAYTGLQAVAIDRSEILAYGAKGAIKFRVNAAKANVFGIDGRCVAKGVKGTSLTLPAGVYVVELNGKTSKVIVR